MSRITLAMPRAPSGAGRANQSRCITAGRPGEMRGAECQNRTDDILFTRQVLCQLS